MVVQGISAPDGDESNYKWRWKNESAYNLTFETYDETPDRVTNLTKREDANGAYDDGLFI